MKNKLVQTVVGSFLGLLMLFAAGQVFVAGQGNEKQEQRNERNIQGTWRTVVTPRNCQTGTPVAPAFPGLLGFNDGGTLAGTSTVAPSVYGVWKRENGWRNYSFAFANLRFNSSGTFIGTQTVRQTAKIAANGNEFTSTGIIEVFDTNGTQIGAGCATSTGTRFE